MKNRLNAIIATALSLTIAVSGVSIASLQSAEAETVTPIKTIAFDSADEIMAANDSAAAIVTDEERGSVISLGAGDANKDLVGAQISNPWADATVNPDGAKEYTEDDIKAAFNYALAIPHGEKFFFSPSKEHHYPVKPEGEGGVTWKSLTVSTAAKTNGAVAEGTDNSINDSTGNYRGAEVAQKALGDTYASTVVKRDGNDLVHEDGNKVKVSAYKVEKEADYVRPVWEKEDGLTMSVWVKVPEGTPDKTILFAFFNDRIPAAMDSTVADTFNNTTGHFNVMADGSIEFMELSHYAGDKSQTSGGYAISRYSASRNRYQTPAIGSEEGVNAVSNPGEWVCVTLVCENDYVSVYFDGIQVNYIESNIASANTVDGTFVQDWENPENSANWTRTEVTTNVKTFNGWFCSRNTPTYMLVNSGVYSSFPSWKGKSAHKMQPCTTAGNEGGSILMNKPRITLCQWLQDSATTLYLGGASGKDLSTWGPNAEGIDDYACVKQYTVLEGTMFDSFEFYTEALTSDEVAAAYVAAGGVLEITPAPSETTAPDPTETAGPAPTETTSPEPTETTSPEPTETTSPEPTETASPEPTETASPEPTETTSPEPTETASPEPTETASPEPTETASPEPTATATPEPTGTLGDVNNDGKINAQDALAVLKHAARLEILEGTPFAMADVTKDTKVDATDALNILKHAAGLPVEF